MEFLTDQGTFIYFCRRNKTGADIVGVNTDLELLTPAGDLGNNTALFISAPTKLPFDVEEVVREQVSKFFQQQQAMMQLDGPPDPSS